MQVTPQLLGTFPVLKLLPENVLEELSAKSKLHRLARRGVVLKAGEKINSVCFVFEGRLQGIDFTIDGREVGLFFVEPGDFCGELALFDDGPQPEYVIALTSATVVAIPVATLRQVMFRTPQAMSLLGARLARRIRQLAHQRTLLGLPNIAQRVCCQLWLLVAHQIKAETESIPVSNPPTHMEIAIMLNMSRESVSRVFQALQGRHIVKRDGANMLIINDLQKLKLLAEGSEKL